jgi:hypothetical protein
MPSDAVVSLPSPGAGRSVDVYGHDMGGGTWGVTTATARGGLAVPNGNIQVWKGTLANLSGPGYFKGRHSLKISHPGVADYSRYYGATHNCQCERPAETIPDNLACFSIRAVLCWDAFDVVRNADEYGVSLVAHALDAGVGYVLPGSSNVGNRITFGPINNNVARIIARNGNAGVTVNVNYPLTNPVTGWARWELRSVSATDSSDAYVVGFINKRQVTDRIRIGALHEAGTAPPIDDASANVGYYGGWVWVANTVAGGIGLYYGGMWAAFAPTEAALD